MKVVLIHGKNATPKDKWYPWFINQINKRKIEIVAPELPNPNDPEIDSWVNEIDRTKPDENTILIGHSRGGVAILRWLEKIPDEVKVKKVILVGTNSGKSEKMNVTENNKGFYTKEGYNFEKIRFHCKDFVVIHSKDDKWVSFSAGEENAKGLNAKFEVYENKGHFGKDVKEFPELLEIILNDK